MQPVIDLLCIAVLAVFIIDVSGFKSAILKVFSAILKREVAGFRPFTCSLCMTWWTGLAYLLITGTVTLPYLSILALIAALTKPMSGAFIFIIEALQAACDWLMTQIGL